MSGALHDAAPTVAIGYREERIVHSEVKQWDPWGLMLQRIQPRGILLISACIRVINLQGYLAGYEARQMRRTSIYSMKENKQGEFLLESDHFSRDGPSYVALKWSLRPISFESPHHLSPRLHQSVMRFKSCLSTGVRLPYLGIGGDPGRPGQRQWACKTKTKVGELSEFRSRVRKAAASSTNNDLSSPRGM